MIDLTSKLGEINDIEHYKGSQVIFDCIMPSIPLKLKYLRFKYHSVMGQCFSKVVVVFKKSKKKKNFFFFFFFFFLLFLIGKIRHGIGKKCDYF